MLSGARTELPSLHYHNLHSWNRAEGFYRMSPVSSDTSYELMSRQPSVWDVMGFGANAPFYRTGPAEPPAANAADVYSEIRELETELSRLLQSLRSPVNTGARQKTKTRIEEIRAAFNAIADRARRSSLSKDEIRMIEHRVRTAIGVLLSPGSAEMRILSGVKYYEPFRVPPSMGDASSDRTLEAIRTMRSVWDVTGSGARRPFFYSDGASGGGRPEDQAHELRVRQARRFADELDNRLARLRTVLGESVSFLNRQAERSRALGSAMPDDDSVRRERYILQGALGHYDVLSRETETFIDVLGIIVVKLLKHQIAAEKKKAEDLARTVDHTAAGSGGQEPVRYFDFGKEPRSMSDSSSDGTLEAIRNMRSVWDVTGSGAQRPFFYSDGSWHDDDINPGEMDAIAEDFPKSYGLLETMSEKFGIQMDRIVDAQLVLVCARIRDELGIGHEYGLFNRVLEGFIDETVGTPADFVAAFKDYARKFLLLKVASASGSGGQGSGPASAHFFENPASAHMTMADDPTSIDAFRAGIDAVGLVGGASSSTNRPFYRSGPSTDSTVTGMVEDTGETSGGAFEGGAGQLAGAGGTGTSHQRVAQRQVAGARTMVQTRAHASLPVVTPAMAPIRSTLGRL